MNNARSPSGNHSRMSGGNNNRWSCEYGRKRLAMLRTLLARAALTQHFQSDRLLAAHRAEEVVHGGESHHRVLPLLVPDGGSGPAVVVAGEHDRVIGERAEAAGQRLVHLRWIAARQIRATA